MLHLCQIAPMKLALSTSLLWILLLTNLPIMRHRERSAGNTGCMGSTLTTRHTASQMEPMHHLWAFRKCRVSCTHAASSFNVRVVSVAQTLRSIRCGATCQALPSCLSTTYTTCTFQVAPLPSSGVNCSFSFSLYDWQGFGPSSLRTAHRLSPFNCTLL